MKCKFVIPEKTFSTGKHVPSHPCPFKACDDDGFCKRHNPAKLLLYAVGQVQKAQEKLNDLEKQIREMVKGGAI